MLPVRPHDRHPASREGFSAPTARRGRSRLQADPEGNTMDQETDDRLIELMRAVLFIAKKRIGQRDFTPYGVCLAIDGTIAWQGVEGSHTVEDLMTLFKGLAPKAEAFAIVTMVPSGGPDGECLFFNIVE